jgi:hypothetical protein
MLTSGTHHTQDPGSLKAFHMVFVACSVVLAILLGLWGVLAFSESRDTGSLVVAVVGWLAAAILLVYGRLFIRKMRRIAFQP